MIFYVDGDEVAWVNLYPSQKQRLELLMQRLGRYASRFGYNFQFTIEKTNN